MLMPLGQPVDGRSTVDDVCDVDECDQQLGTKWFSIVCDTDDIIHSDVELFENSAVCEWQSTSCPRTTPGLESPCSSACSTSTHASVQCFQIGTPRHSAPNFGKKDTLMHVNSCSPDIETTSSIYDLCKGLRFLDITADPREQERRHLCNLLWESLARWAPRDLLLAERRLFKVGIHCVPDLTSFLQSRIRKQLQIDTKLFTPTDVQQLAVHLGIAKGSECNVRRKPRTKERLLCDLVWDARPSWTPVDFVAAETKLELIGVRTLDDLDKVLPGHLNTKLKQAGLKSFSSETISAFKCYLDKVYHRDDKQAAWMDSVGESSLHDVLWETRPSWTAADVSAAEKKLAVLGITDVGGLSEALTTDINKSLQAAGKKPFLDSTIEELRLRLHASGKGSCA